MQECAKIRVNECEYTKNWKNVFADVCIFFFWRQSYLTSFSSVTTRQSSSSLDSALAAPSFADFCLFYVPPPSLGVTLVTLKQRHLRWLSATYICRFYILRRKVDSAWESEHSSWGNEHSAWVNEPNKGKRTKNKSPWHTCGWHRPYGLPRQYGSKLIHAVLNH